MSRQARKSKARRARRRREAAEVKPSATGIAPENVPLSSSPGGIGGNVQEAPIAPETLADHKMVTRAVKARWPIVEGARPLIMQEMTRIALDRKEKNRERIAAAKLHLEAEKINFAQEARDAAGFGQQVTVPVISIVINAPSPKEPDPPPKLVDNIEIGEAGPAEPDDGE